MTYHSVHQTARKNFINSTVRFDNQPHAHLVDSIQITANYLCFDSEP